MLKNKKYFKAIGHSHYTRGAVHSICNLKYSLPQEISIAFTIYLTMINDYHFIVNELAEEQITIYLFRRKS